MASQSNATGPSISPAAFHCHICFDPDAFQLTTPCNHSFCPICIDDEYRYRGNNIRCPMCRTNISAWVTETQANRFQDSIERVTALVGWMRRGVGEQPPSHIETYGTALASSNDLRGDIQRSMDPFLNVAPPISSNALVDAARLTGHFVGSGNSTREFGIQDIGGFSPRDDNEYRILVSTLWTVICERDGWWFRAVDLRTELVQETLRRVRAQHGEIHFLFEPRILVFNRLISVLMHAFRLIAQEVELAPQSDDSDSGEDDFTGDRSDEEVMSE